MIALLVGGAIFDLRVRRIPNGLTLGGALLGCVVNLTLHQLTGALTSLEGWAVGVLVLAIPFILRGIGGGDVKLLAAAGAWQGPNFVVMTAVLGAIIGAVIAIGILLANRRLLETLRPVARWVVVLGAFAVSPIVPRAYQWASTRQSSGGPSRAPKDTIYFPYGPVLATGGIVALIVA